MRDLDESQSHVLKNHVAATGALEPRNTVAH